MFGRDERDAIIGMWFAKFMFFFILEAESKALLKACEVVVTMQVSKMLMESDCKVFSGCCLRSLFLSMASC